MPFSICMKKGVSSKGNQAGLFNFLAWINDALVDHDIDLQKMKKKLVAKIALGPFECKTGSILGPEVRFPKGQTSC